MVFTIKWQQLCGVQNRLFWGGSQPSKVAHACWGGVPGMKCRRFTPTFGVRRDMWVVVWLIAAKLHSHHPGHFRPYPLRAPVSR
eukprot:scaffold89471_cov67-Phaeocystis_antarctica.AAC.2